MDYGGFEMIINYKSAAHVTPTKASALWTMTFELNTQMSKYELLLQSLSCLWQKPDGILCGEDFTNAKTFTNHLRNQHLSNRGSTSSGHGGLVCNWDGCGQAALGSQSEYVCHVLFHPYHCFLKLLGLELQV